MNFVRKSLQLELDDFFTRIIKWFYEDTEFKTFKGFRLLSIDGTILEISNTESLRDEFGYIENQNVVIPRYNR